ncbi:MAG: UrcA family protein [Sphingobium sp.]|nr:UrcA family protein [Sphingobium sp.]
MKIYSPLLATVLLLSAPAFAKDHEVPVAYGDLNLSSPEGRDALDHRLRVAAEKACVVQAAPIEQAKLERRCRALAIADAREKAQVAVARAQTNEQLAAR